MLMHGAHLHSGQNIVDERDVLVPKLAAVHQGSCAGK